MERMELQANWVLDAIESLRSVDSWTGRVHVQKLLFVIDALKLAKPPFQFALYHYGPYSREIDDLFGFLEVFGEIECRYPRIGYGPQYDAQKKSPGRISADELQAMKFVANQFGKSDSKALERIATCLWVMEREKISSENEIIKRVGEAKPKYSTEQIRESLLSANELRTAAKAYNNTTG